MNHMNQTEHITNALARAHQVWHERLAPPAFTIAISRETGTPGAAIARAVAERLGWPLYDRELLQRIATDLGVKQQHLEPVDERRVGWLREAFTGLFAVPEVTEQTYFRKLIETLFALAARGECVIVGRGSAVALPKASTLRVRIVAPREDRVETICQEHGVSVFEAAERVDTSDRERDSFVSTHFNVDPTDPANYDLVLNVARFTPGECADLIIEALHRMQKRAAARPQFMEPAAV